MRAQQEPTDSAVRLLCGFDYRINNPQINIPEDEKKEDTKHEKGHLLARLCDW